MSTLLHYKNSETSDNTINSVTINYNSESTNNNTYNSVNTINTDNSAISTNSALITDISDNTTATQWYLPLQLRCRCSPHLWKGPPPSGNVLTPKERTDGVNVMIIAIGS